MEGRHEEDSDEWRTWEVEEERSVIAYPGDLKVVRGGLEICVSI